MQFGAGSPMAARAATASQGGPKCSVIYATIAYRRSMPVRLALTVLGRTVPGFRRVVTDTPRYRVLSDPPIITKRLDQALNSEDVANFATLHLLLQGCYASAPKVTTLRPEALTTTSEPEADFRIDADADGFADGEKVLVVVPKGPIWARRFRRGLILSTTGAVIGCMGVFVDYLACHALAEAFIKATSAAGGLGNRSWRWYRAGMLVFAALSTGLIILVSTLISEPLRPVLIKPDPSGCQAVAALRHISGVLRDAAAVDSEFEARIRNGWGCSMLNPSTWDTSIMFSADIDRVSKAAGLWLALRALLGAGTTVGMSENKFMVNLVTKPESDGAAHMLAKELRGTLHKEPCGEHIAAVYKAMGEASIQYELEQGILRFIYTSVLRTAAHDWAFYTVAELFAKQQDSAKKVVLVHPQCTDELRKAVTDCDSAVRERTTYVVPVMNVLRGIDGGAPGESSRDESRNDREVAVYMKHVLQTSVDPERPPVQSGRFRIYVARQEVDASVTRREVLITVSNIVGGTDGGDEDAADSTLHTAERTSTGPSETWPSYAVRQFCAYVYDPWKPLSAPMHPVSDLLGIDSAADGNGIHEDFALPLTVRYALHDSARFGRSELDALDEKLDDALDGCAGKGLSFHIFGGNGQAGAIAQLITPHLCDSECGFAYKMQSWFGGQTSNYCANGGVHLQPVALHTLDADPVFNAKGAERIKAMPWVRHMRFQSQPTLFEHVRSTIVAKGPRFAPDPQLTAHHFGTRVFVDIHGAFDRAMAAESSACDDELCGVARGRDFAMMPEPAVAAALCGSDAVTATTREKLQLRFVHTVPSVFQLALNQLSCLNYVAADEAFQGA